MIENIKAVNNPLTIIAIFAALAEIVGTVALKTVDKELQYVFVWFVVGFPTLLGVLFFVTLNFNPKVLYAPSDFKDESNFLKMGTHNVSLGLDELNRQLEERQNKILGQIAEHINTYGRAEISQISKLYDYIDDLYARIRDVAKILQMTNETIKAAVRESDLQRELHKREGHASDTPSD